MFPVKREYLFFVYPIVLFKNPQEFNLSENLKILTVFIFPLCANFSYITELIEEQ